MTEKYMVYRYDEMIRWLYSLNSDNHTVLTALEAHPAPVEDAVVLRLQDRFTAGALRCYMHQLMAALEMIEDFALPSVIETERLREIADYFDEMATRSENMQRRIPD